MLTTHSQTQQEKQSDVGRAIQDCFTSDIESDAKLSTTRVHSAPHLSIRGHSKLIYNIQQLSPRSMTRASIGLPSNFTVEERSKTFRSSGQTYHAIQLQNRVAIRIYDPARSHRVECTCDDFKRTGSNCVHIYWLFDSLNVAFARLSPSAVHSVTEETVSARIADSYNQLGRHLINGSLHKIIGKTSVDHADVIQSIQDMLSVFDIKYLSEHQGNESTTAIPNDFTSYEDLIIPGNLAATIFGLARHNEVFRRELRNALTKDLCAVRFFETLSQNAREIFEHLDQYTQHGPPSSPHFVDECASCLRHIVESITNYKDSRAPLKISTKCKAAGILVDILIGVCRHNPHTFPTLLKQEEAPDHKSAVDQDLFTILIGNPPQHGIEMKDAGEQDLFFLDNFSTFAPEERWHLLEPIKEALYMLKLNKTPSIFIQRLEEMVEENENNGSGRLDQI